MASNEEKKLSFILPSRRWFFTKLLTSIGLTGPQTWLDQCTVYWSNYVCDNAKQRINSSAHIATMWSSWVFSGLSLEVQFEMKPPVKFLLACAVSFWAQPSSKHHKTSPSWLYEMNRIRLMNISFLLIAVRTCSPPLTMFCCVTQVCIVNTTGFFILVMFYFICLSKSCLPRLRPELRSGLSVLLTDQWNSSPQ